MLELATLGLLQDEPLHGYRLKQQLEQFIGGCICVNYGTIYPLLKRLEERQEVVALTEEAGKAGPSRKIYGITAHGRDRWRQKMLEYPQESWVNARSRFIIKFFFFSQLSPAERVKLLEHRLIVCQLRLANQKVEPVPTDPYQTAIRQRFIAVLQDEILWLSEQLAREQNQPIKI